ncbi:MAG: NADH-quinone oxidoreductase subunit NuoH [Planctomycetota bacterium]|nr:MAG: NADH-quinone oxidoreductase subunit NuoH [Planctomycetota bacterium]
MADFFHYDLGLWPGVAKALAAVIQCALLLNVVAVGALVFIWLERKVSGRIQDRLGPTRVGGKFGWLQTLADGVKLITKEDLVPKEADGFLFKAAPYISFCSSFAAYMALPFSSGWVGLPINTAVFFIVAVVGLEVFGVILAGYASGSKWSLFGGMREAAQVVSYEVPLGLCVVVPVVIAGTMDLVAIGDMQAGLFTNWFVLHDPFTFITFFVYLTCATASVNRAPFDLAEAESELVAGFHTEYSGLRWSIFFMAEYGSMFAVSALAAILFLGGWNGPIPLTSLLGLTDVGEPAAIGAFLSWLCGEEWGPRVAGYLGRLLGMTNLIFKACLGVTAMMWVRWTLPRLRIDQVITTCLKYCTPIAAVMFVGACLWKVGGIPFANDFVPHQDRLEVRESYHRTWGKPREDKPKAPPITNATTESTVATAATR